MSTASHAPDLVVVGSARSGTTFLSASLARHPRVDAGSVKEPNYFSSRWHRGPDWYDSLYGPRTPGTKRVDGSVSYTYPQHPLALERIQAAAPDVQVVYTVREPLARLVSHYQLFRYYYGRTDWGSLEEAMRRSEMFLGAGDYGHWLTRIAAVFDPSQVLVVPFPRATADPAETVDLLLKRMGLEPELAGDKGPTEAGASADFRNEVRDFRFGGFRAVQRQLHGGRLYPALRARVGPERVRRMRQLLTRPATTQPALEEIQGLPDEVRSAVVDHADSAVGAVSDWLTGQDAALGTDWTAVWRDHVRTGDALRA